MPECAASQTEYARYAWCGPAASRTWTFRSYQAVGVNVIVKVSANPWSRLCARLLAGVRLIMGRGWRGTARGQG